MVLSLGCLKSSAHNFQTIHISIIIQIGYHDHWLLINYVKPKFFRGEPKCIYIFFGRGGARGWGGGDQLSVVSGARNFSGVNQNIYIYFFWEGGGEGVGGRGGGGGDQLSVVSGARS